MPFDPVESKKITLQMDGSDFEIYGGQYRLIFEPNDTEKRGRHIVTSDFLHFQFFNEDIKEWQDIPLVQKFSYEVSALDRVPKITLEFLDYKK